MTEFSYEQYLARQEKRALAIKSMLVQELNAAGATHVIAEYDGEGDSGQINNIVAYRGSDFIDCLQDNKTLHVCVDGDCESYDSLQECIDDFAWSLLGRYHDGFWNNDGGYGTLTIDVANNSITIDHNDRVFDVVRTETEI